MHRNLFKISYEDIISIDNLLEAWQEFIVGKRSRKDVQLFELSLMENLITLHESLESMKYRHDSYTAFVISDPKTRQIHKASVADRVLHRAIYRKLYSFFDSMFIFDSYSCRIGKGTHKALDRFTVFSRKVTRNHSKTGWVLKCDIKKFFASVDQEILLQIMDPYIVDGRIIWLLKEILGSFPNHGSLHSGLPLGNLTSQLFSNVYMNIFDQFVKRVLRIKYYIRYADDFALFSHNRRYLEQILPLLDNFLYRELYLHLHPGKTELRTLASGIDFLGWVHFPHYRVLRTVTKRRMFKKVGDDNIDSYLSLLKHGNGFELSNLVKNKKL
ncbi:reverse transcriptase/maturase family protein [Patescibacteria group bacterium]|nr:reverse transcriptase/maturase family protein [Patescibacteria group bacterium]